MTIESLISAADNSKHEFESEGSIENAIVHIRALEALIPELMRALYSPQDDVQIH
ncbi:MAG: hypothetical protein VW202_11995 [Halieaceae bacterium]